MKELTDGNITFQINPTLGVGEIWAIPKEMDGDMIRKRGGKWVLLSKDSGKVLGTHSSKEKAQAQEAAINIAKHIKKGKG